jgi:hypothetical protein
MGLTPGRRPLRRVRERAWSEAAQLTARQLDPEIPSTFSDVERAIRRSSEAHGMSKSWPNVTTYRGLLELEELGAVLHGEWGYLIASRSDNLVMEAIGRLKSTRTDLVTLEGRSRFEPDPAFVEGSRERWNETRRVLDELTARVERALDSPTPRSPASLTQPRAAALSPRHRTRGDEPSN